MTRFNDLEPERRRWLARLGGYAANAKYGAKQTEAARAAQRVSLIARYIPNADELDPAEVDRRYRQLLSVRMKAVRRARAEKRAARLAAEQAARVPG